jgi:F420-non-reducing hydrogenase small subunit
MSAKPKLAMYWAASCGGCEISLVNLHEKILDIDAIFDFVFCPCLLDTKRKDLEQIPDGGIAVTLFNGAIRTEENEEMAHLMRRKSSVLVAYGACAASGSIPALSNLHTRDEHVRDIYLQGPSLANPDGVVPRTSTAAPEGELELPAFYERVKRLNEVVEVDYYVPGCPPESHQLWEAVQVLLSPDGPPPRGAVLGAGSSTVCDQCSRTRERKQIGEFHRTYEIVPDESRCLFDQGIVCMGVATRGGCGALCPKVNMPCSGCYGAPEGVRDQGGKMVAVLGSVFAPGLFRSFTEQQLADRAEEAFEAIPDPAGTFYRYTLAGSILGRKRI